MNQKKIGGQCQIRIDLVKLLESIPEGSSQSLNRQQRVCIFKCNGYDYDCSKYEGYKINLGRKDDRTSTPD